MTSRELQNEIVKMTKEYHWEEGDILDFICEFLANHDDSDELCDELIEHLQDELEELGDMSDMKDED
jgi:predicted small metal-binding protein